MPRLRGAWIGFGNIAERGHGPAYQASREIEMLAVMDPSVARQKAARALHPELRVYASVDDLFRREKLDFVDICTPPASHAALALAALEQGCHVLCEKPLCLEPAAYGALAAAQRRSGKIVFTVHNWKYAPIFQKTFSLLREGRIGPVWHAEIFTLRNSHCKGAAQGSSAAQGKSEDWRTDPSISGGGILVDHGWHSFYLLLNLISAEPESVLARMTPAQEEGRTDVLEESAQTLVHFAHAEGYVHLTWRSPLRRNAVIVQGRDGALLLDDDRILLTVRGEKQQEIVFGAALSAGSHHADWFQTLLPDFIEEIRHPSKGGENFREAGACLALMQASYASNRRGCRE